MRILVTGGAGYIGSHAVRLFLDRGHDVWVYDNLALGHRKSVPADRLVQGGLDEVHRIDHVLLDKRIEAVVHFAAWAAVGESVKDPAKYYQNNLVNTLGLMECLRRHKIDRFVFSSTAATFGTPSQMPITEETPQQPINPYGRTKLAVEHALGDYCAAYNWGFAALRYFNASGARADASIGEDHDPETHLIPLVIYAAMGLRPHIEIFGTDYPTPDGTCVRDYIHVDDLAEAHLLALENLKPGRAMHYNLGIGRGYSVREVVRAVEEVTGKKVPVKEGSRRPGDPPVLVASSDKIQRELGWKPHYTDLKAIVQTAWNWHSKNPKGYKDLMSAEQPGSLAGRVALVMGAGVGIGRATALAFARAGATVGLHYHTSEAGARETLDAIHAAGGTAHLLQADLSVEAEACRVVDRLVEQTGRLDVLFNNAGSPLQFVAIADCPTELWRRIFDVNVHGAFFVTRRAIPHLRASGKGAIVNNLSLSVQTGGSGGGGPYAAAKGALQVMTRTLARELAPQVRVNGIMPGVIATGHHATFSTPAKMEDYRKQTPLARNGTAEEVADAVLFLASDAARFVTGALLDINGGRFLR